MESKAIGDEGRRDLVVLVADLTMQVTLRTILSRHKALGIRKLDFLVIPHPEHDPGVFLRSPDFLKPLRKEYHHALVMCDLEGSGGHQLSSVEMAQDLTHRLSLDWDDKCAVIVFDPELEIWLWSQSPEVDRVLGWHERTPSLREWLVENELLSEGGVKPKRPKEAVERALKTVRKPRSAALYGRLAGTVSLRRCEDSGFLRFRTILRTWFG